MKRTLISTLAMLLLLACGDSTTGPSSTPGSIVFILDADTCGPEHSGVLLTLYIDGMPVGSFIAESGSESPSYSVNPGYHTVGAVLEGFQTWSTHTVTVQGGKTYTQRLNCGESLFL